LISCTVGRKLGESSVKRRAWWINERIWASVGEESKEGGAEIVTENDEVSEVMGGGGW
jgi:hypothetical protein